MDRISHLRVFIEAARLASFSAAARKLELTRDQVSKQIAALESELGTPLFARSTRSITLSTAGEALLGRAEAIVALFDEALGEVRGLSGAPRGALRVNAPMSFGQRHLAPLVAGFSAAYPEVQLRIDLDDRFVDPTKTGADVTLRIAQLPEHLDLVARPIAIAPRWLVVAPAQLAAVGEPTHPDQLSRLACLPYGEAGAALPWQFRPADAESATKAIGVTTRGPLCSNNGDVLLRGAVDGLGFTVLPAFMVQDEIAAGRLRRVMRDWQVTPDIGVFALYASSARSSPTIRAFVEFFGPRLREALVVRLDS
ncbi:LysR family transcriptional regulator [Roseateles sp.]|uniref:LysR family transcriptional regulator n=1 Tax=Roseateles sp. TaxID=1971397 RepID=UPI0025F5C360|nr:LysR family transcriptional regulator [Roseateles sp.]MBV8033628.1 LysR family transcriptional regulator [Roseateles sp.]